VLIGFADEVAGPEVAFSVLDAGFEVLAFTRRQREVGVEPARLRLQACPHALCLDLRGERRDVFRA